MARISDAGSDFADETAEGSGGAFHEELSEAKSASADRPGRDFCDGKSWKGEKAAGDSEGQSPLTEGYQLSLFQLDDPTLSAIRDKLKAADLDNMTPMQAFDLLRSMKAELGL